MLPINLVVNYIITYCQHNKVTLNISVLHRLTYYVQAWHLVYFDNVLFSDTTEAWMSGPAYRFIQDVYGEADFETLNSVIIEKDDLDEVLNTLSISIDQAECLDAVLKNYTSISIDQLIYRAMTEYPWNKARENTKLFEYDGEFLSHDVIRDYYKSKIMKRKSETT